MLLVSTDPAHSISDVIGSEIGAEEREVSQGFRALEIDAETEVGRYLDQARAQLASAFNPAVLKEALRQIELTATMPGVADVAVFERMTEILLTRQDDIDLVVFDTAPTGHTLRLLNLPESMGVWVTALADRRRAARDVRDAAGLDGGGPAAPPDPVLDALDRRAARLQRVRARLVAGDASVVLVLVPERLPIEETARAIGILGAAGIRVGAIVINRVLPGDLAGEFYRSRKAQERAYLDEIERRFAAQALLRVPQFETDVRGLADLARVADALGA